MHPSKNDISKELTDHDEKALTMGLDTETIEIRTSSVQKALEPLIRQVCQVATVIVIFLNFVAIVVKDLHV